MQGDYLGFSIYSRLLLGDRQFLDDLQVTGDEPEDVFGRVADIVTGLAREFSRLSDFGAVIHLCNMAGLFQNDFVLEPYLDATRNHPSGVPIVTGIHINFDHGNLPLAPGFTNTFVETMELARMVDADAVVLHAPLIETSNTDGDWIDLMLGEEIIESMRRNQAILCWENAQDSIARYRLLEKLVKWREKMADALERAGHPDLAERHAFCLDTGHLLVSLQRDGAPRSEVDTWLPEFGKHVKVFHIQCNDGTKDQHRIPFMDLKRFGLDKDHDLKRFQRNSNLVLDWLGTCDEVAGIGGRHLHLEVDTPMPLDQVQVFYERYLGMPAGGNFRDD